MGLAEWFWTLFEVFEERQFRVVVVLPEFGKCKDGIQAEGMVKHSDMVMCARFCRVDEIVKEVCKCRLVCDFGIGMDVEVYE